MDCCCFQEALDPAEGEAERPSPSPRAGTASTHFIHGQMQPSPLPPLAPVLWGEVQTLGVDAKDPLQHGALVTVYDVFGKRQDILTLKGKGRDLTVSKEAHISSPPAQCC